MHRPYLMPNPHEQMLFEIVMAQEHRLQLLTSLLSRALPTAGFQGDMGRAPDFSRKIGGSLFHVTEGQLLPQLTREGVLAGMGPKFREAYGKAQSPEEWQRLWRRLKPVSADSFGRTIFETYFHNPWHAYQTHSWVTEEMSSKSRDLQAQNLPLYASIYRYFEEATDMKQFQSEKERIAFYCQPNSKITPVLFGSTEGLALAIPVRHYSHSVIVSEYLPFHGAYLILKYDSNQRRYSHLGSAWWCEIEQCWLEDFNSTTYLTAEEIQHGVEVFEHFFGLPKYHPVQATELQMLYASVEAWICKREAGVAQTRKLNSELSKYYNWSESLRVGRLRLDIPDRAIYSYPELRLQCAELDDDGATPSLTFKMFTYASGADKGRKSVWAGDSTNSLPPKRLYHELVELLTAWLDAAEKGEFDDHKFKAWGYDDNFVTDPDLFYHEHDPTREQSDDNTTTTT